jgi:hypothetical protein
VGARTAVRRIAVHGLPESPAPVATAPLGGGEWRALRTFVAHHRLTGLAVAAAEHGDLPLDPTQRQQLLADAAAAADLTRHLEAVLVEVSGMFAAAGIDHRVLKGPALARLDYPAAALRPFGDIDLLVTGEGLETAIGLLTRAGGRRRYPEPRPGFDRRFGKGVCVVLPDGTEVDLHRTLAAGPFGLTVDLDDLWSKTSPVVVGGRPLPALDPAARLLHACLHAALGNHPPRLLALRDVAQVWLATRPDPAEVLGRARRWGVTAVVARAVTTAWETLGLADGGPLVAWAVGHDPGPRDRALLAVYERAGARYAGQALASLRVLPGLRDRAAYLRALAFPERGYVVGRHRGRARRLVAGLSAARRGAR